MEAKFYTAMNFEREKNSSLYIFSNDSEPQKEALKRKAIVSLT